MPVVAISSFPTTREPGAIGHLSGITDREGTVSFAYDAAGRITSETRTISGRSYSIGYSYHPTSGELAGMSYPSGMNLTYGRDEIGQVSSIQANGTPLISSITHLPFGPWQAATLGSVNLTRDYDQRYNTTRIKADSFDYLYTRDAGGRVITIANYQVPNATTGQSDYSYNPANNQLTGVTGPSLKTYTYDANGNILSDGTVTFIYDGLNRIIQVERQDLIIATYGYDSSNRRIRKTVDSTTTHYLYDLNNQLIAETSVADTPIREYIYLDGEPIALKEYQNNPGTYYYINDHLGTPQQLVDSAGTVVWLAAYLPYGQTQVQTEVVENNLRFPGQYYDAETGLHYNWHRFYDPETGRYITADPIGLKGGLNLYSYTNQNPINYVDPEGLNVALWMAIYEVSGTGYNDLYKHCYVSCKGNRMDGAEYNTENLRVQLELTNIQLGLVEAWQTFFDMNKADPFGTLEAAKQKNWDRDMPSNRAGNECAEDCTQTCEDCCSKYAGGKFW